MTMAVLRTANQGPDTMKPSQQSDEFRLDDSSQSCLAIAYLRLIDLDIIASDSKAQKKKMSDRNAYVKLLGKLAPIDTTESQLSSLNGPLSDNLRTRCNQVSSLEHQAVILSELAFFKTDSSAKISLFWIFMSSTCQWDKKRALPKVRLLYS